MTYVELIMVISIVGVVGAMAIPGLKKHSSKTQMAQLAKKAYFNLEEAMDNAVLSEGPMRNWDFSSNKKFCEKYLAPNLNTMQVSCNSDDDGASYVLTRDMMRMSVAECNGKLCHIHIDVNDLKGPNKVGKDFFEFQINRVSNGEGQNAEGVQPAGYGGADLLRMNDWQFTDKLWRCEWAVDGAGDCGL